jgi:hypothetical protein
MLRGMLHPAGFAPFRPRPEVNDPLIPQSRMWPYLSMRHDTELTPLRLCCPCVSHEKGGNPTRCFTACSIAGSSCILALLWLQVLSPRFVLIAGGNVAAVLQSQALTGAEHMNLLVLGDSTGKHFYRDQEAAFGPSVPHEGLSGYLRIAGYTDARGPTVAAA